VDAADDRTMERVFTSKPMRDLPMPTADVWQDDEFGTALMAEYLERARLDYDNNPHLRIFKVAAGIVHGSNPFAACLVDMIARPEVRVATPVDLQALLDAQGRTENALKLTGTYKDMGLVLRSVREPNSYLAAKLNEQVGLKEELPVAIYLSGLRLVNDGDSPYGLGFEFTADTTVVSAPVLTERSGHFDNGVVDRSTGLPTKIEGTHRYYYGCQHGLTRMYLGRGFALDTIWDELANSQADGRIVLVDNTVPPARLSAYLGQLDAATALLED